MTSSLDAAAYPAALYDRYLNLLGMRRAEPGWDALRELSSRHLIRIPFENVSKIYRVKYDRKRSVPPLTEYLDGVEKYNFGGTCYTNNYYMHLLLTHLGYSVALCGADISVNGAPPNGHMVNVVTLGGDRAIVDVGYGAPFWHPLSIRSTTDVVRQLGVEKFVLKPVDTLGRSRLEVYRNDELVHGYVMKPEAMEVADFSEVTARSYGDTAPFLNRLMFARFYDNSALVLRNNTLTEMRAGGSQQMTYTKRREIEEVAVSRFGIPGNVISVVMDALGDLGGSLR